MEAEFASLYSNASSMISQSRVDNSEDFSSGSSSPEEVKMFCLLFQWCKGVLVSVAKSRIGCGPFVACCHLR